eukprot:TRINITY_DN3583_c0_g1_i2.p2 TRINITY_DN3583_c0_g1~~TRINITY_DN3583_c0_g1_i2.p2  ORF type:complete len:515 (-),score=70.91 TRINITY_DN3583_c0_g1_i2:81-1625(-)
MYALSTPSNSLLPLQTQVHNTIGPGKLMNFTIITKFDSYALLILTNITIPINVYKDDVLQSFQTIALEYNIQRTYMIVQPSTNYTVLLGPKFGQTTEYYFIKYYAQSDNRTVLYYNDSQYETYVPQVYFDNSQLQVLSGPFIEISTNPRYLIVGSDETMLFRIFEINRELYTIFPPSNQGIQGLKNTSYLSVFYPNQTTSSGNYYVHPIYNISTYSLTPEFISVFEGGIKKTKFISSSILSNNVLHVYNVNAPVTTIYFNSPNTTTYFYLDDSAPMIVSGNKTHSVPSIGKIYAYQISSFSSYEITIYIEPDILPSPYPKNVNNNSIFVPAPPTDPPTDPPTNVPAPPTEPPTVSPTVPPTTPTQTPPPNIETCHSTNCRKVFSFTKNQDCIFGLDLLDYLKNTSKVNGLCMYTNSTTKRSRTIGESYFEYGVFEANSMISTTGVFTMGESDVEHSKLTNFIQLNSNNIISTINTLSQSNSTTIITIVENIATSISMSLFMLYFIIFGMWIVNT